MLYWTAELRRLVSCGTHRHRQCAGNTLHVNVPPPYQWFTACAKPRPSEAVTWLLFSCSHQRWGRYRYYTKCATKTKASWRTGPNSDWNGGAEVLNPSLTSTYRRWLMCLRLTIFKQSLSSLTHCPCHLLYEIESPVLQNSSFWTLTTMVHFWCYTRAPWHPHFLYTRN